MRNQQTIMCDVKVCQHNNHSGCCCNLNSITVTPAKDVETAHYCKDYVEAD